MIHEQAPIRAAWSDGRTPKSWHPERGGAEFPVLCRWQGPAGAGTTPQVCGQLPKELQSNE